VSKKLSEMSAVVLLGLIGQNHNILPISDKDGKRIDKVLVLVNLQQEPVIAPEGQRFNNPGSSWVGDKRCKVVRGNTFVANTLPDSPSYLTVSASVYRTEATELERALIADRTGRQAKRQDGPASEVISL